MSERESGSKFQKLFKSVKIEAMKPSRKSIFVTFKPDIQQLSRLSIVKIFYEQIFLLAERAKWQNLVGIFKVTFWI